MMKMKPNVRYLVLGVLLGLVWLTQLIPALATFYSQTVYPCFSYILSSFSNLFPFAIGDLFIFLSIAGIIIYPIYTRLRKKTPWKKILLRDGEYLLWVYVWFYLAWGLNYSQKNFYQRTEIPYTAYTPENFQKFVNEYITRLNRSYTPINSINRDLIREETVRLYKQLSDSLGVHRPPHDAPRVKTMMFTPFISMVGVTGSMGPFFCEFTLNGDLLPANYPATYAHELAHLLGITSEAEANFYAYQVCTRSQAMGIPKTVSAAGVPPFPKTFDVIESVLAGFSGTDCLPCRPGNECRPLEWLLVHSARKNGFASGYAACGTAFCLDTVRAFSARGAIFLR